VVIIPSFCGGGLNESCVAVSFLGVQARDTGMLLARAEFCNSHSCPIQIQATNAPTSYIDFSETQGCLKSGPDTPTSCSRCFVFEYGVL
jgi:hypothetical protein